MYNFIVETVLVFIKLLNYKIHYIVKSILNVENYKYFYYVFL
jgi:hypothetical protein